MQFNGPHKICQRCVKILHKAGIRTSGVYKTNWKSKEVRQSFLDFFCNKNDHKFVPSSSVIPKKGEGTYFTNAGMNQFKPIFLGTVPAGSELGKYKRVANSQKCIRVGGKHNDLDDVGQDLTHHTFFEMMGSWSFGDYFKKEACAMTLDLLTEVYKIPMDRLYFTYFGGNRQFSLKEDTECKNIWRELGVPAKRIRPCAMKDNFWDMGEVGPCGPCSEIHYDHIGGRQAPHLVNKDSPEVVEIWNLVFMQYESDIRKPNFYRLSDQSLRPLPQQHVDTGMGLERMCAVLQGTLSNYDTDLFTPLFQWLHKTTSAPEYGGKVGEADIDKIDTAYRIIADHTRMLAVSIADGLLPARVGVEQKLRSIMHRTIQQYENVLKGPPDNLAHLVPLVADSLGEAYPEISRNVAKIQEVVNQTEHKYRNTINAGKKQLSKFLKQNGDVKVLSGEHIKALHEGSYGNPMSLDIVEDIAEIYGIALDLDDFHRLISQEKLMLALERHSKTQVQLSQTFVADLHSSGVLPTEDSLKYSYERTADGYSFCSKHTSPVLSIICDNEIVKKASLNDKVSIIVAETPFYSEAGGQAGDKGLIKTETGIVDVFDTQSSHGYVLHHGMVTKGIVTTEQEADLHIDTDHRLSCMKNHTATHLTNAALRQVIGDAKQRGSTVDADKLSFDFASVKSLKNEDIQKVEELVCNTVEKGLPVVRKTLPLHEAMEIDGVVFLENEAYPSEVHVLSIADTSDADSVCHSGEFCGGTHLHNTADIGSFCVCNFSGVAQGIKRIVCLTGIQAEKAVEAGERLTSLYERLETAVNMNSDPHKWKEWRNEINWMVTQEFLPKVVRDKVREKMIHLGTEMSTKQNKLQMEILKMEIDENMTDVNSTYIVKKVSVKTLNNAVRLLETIEISKPVILVVEYGKGTGVLVTVPQDSEAQRTAIVKELDPDMSQTYINNKGNVAVMRTKDRHSDTFVETCERILSRSYKMKSAEAIE